MQTNNRCRYAVTGVDGNTRTGHFNPNLDGPKEWLLRWQMGEDASIHGGLAPVAEYIGRAWLAYLNAGHPTATCWIEHIHTGERIEL